MYALNDYVMYGTTGVCQVVDICNPGFAVDNSLYYTLQPVYDASGTIYAKVDSTKVLIRPSITKEVAQKYLALVKDMEVLWYNNDKIRDAEFKNVIKSGDVEKWLSMVKGLYAIKKQKEAEGKKLSQADTILFQKAEKLLFGELAFALNSTIDNIHGWMQTELADCALSL